MNLTDAIYSELLINMNNQMIVEFGSIKKASESMGFSRFNWSKIMKEEHQLSIGLYIRVARHVFENDGPFINTEDCSVDMTIPVKEWLKINHTAIFSTILKFQYL